MQEMALIIIIIIIIITTDILYTNWRQFQYTFTVHLPVSISTNIPSNIWSAATCNT
jgi:hypothetical protein